MPKPTQAEFVCSLNSGLSKEPAPVLQEPCNLGSDAQGEVTPGQSQDASLPSSCFTDKFWHFSQLKNLVAQYIFFSVPELSAYTAVGVRPTHWRCVSSWGWGALAGLC